MTALLVGHCILGSRGTTSQPDEYLSHRAGGARVCRLPGRHGLAVAAGPTQADYSTVGRTGAIARPTNGFHTGGNPSASVPPRLMEKKVPPVLRKGDAYVLVIVANSVYRPACRVGSRFPHISGRRGPDSSDSGCRGDFVDRPLRVGRPLRTATFLPTGVAHSPVGPHGATVVLSNRRTVALRAVVSNGFASVGTPAARRNSS